MILRVRLQNFASFGELQMAQLEPITVIVGANNSGKTNFLRIAEFMRTRGGEFTPYFHRPPVGDGSLRIEWEGELPLLPDGQAGEVATYSFQASRRKDGLELNESVKVGRRSVYQHGGRFGKNTNILLNQVHVGSAPPGINANSLSVSYRSQQQKACDEIAAVFDPVFKARQVHLSIPALRDDSQLQPTPMMDPAGSMVAALLAHWTLEYPEKMIEFNEIITKCLPEMKRVIVRCEQPGMVRVLFEQRDGERFDSTQVSDGVVVFAGLIAHALNAPPKALVLIEEPERAIHPRRLAELVDLLRTIVQQHQSQFIMATHSPALLNEFRSEPEAVLTFRRGSNGTIIRRLSDIKELEETLMRSDPGELLANGFFNEDPEVSSPKKPTTQAATDD